jgi:pantoate--beta-alanine ligase
MREFQAKHIRPKGTTLGFVPTMGALHSGHISLMKEAKKENDLVIASIFVNPTQFSAGEDLDKYPRQVEKDMNLLKENKIDLLFLPQEDQMYSKNPLCHVEPVKFNSILEGKARPEFFRGVATIVSKLFNIVQPTTSYFGQKDISQCILIKKMVEDLNFDTKIKIIETIRDADGLALSSRNAYLTSEERKIADVLYRGLSHGVQLFEQHKDQITKQQVVEEMERIIFSEPKVSRIEYISIANHDNMEEYEQSRINCDRDGIVISSAIRLGNVRLIDNLLVGKAKRDILG